MKPLIGNSVTVQLNDDNENPELLNGIVTDLLSTQFIYRREWDGIPLFAFYTDKWELNDE